MTKEIFKKIIEYEKIIIHRHTFPDLDAYGSQLGLKEILKINFPNKKIYIVGDDNKYLFENKMDNINDDEYKNALAFVLDTSVDYMVSDDRYKLAKELIVIDHHLNETNLKPTLFYQNTKVISCSEMIVDLALDNKLIINDQAANYLYLGIIGDSGRFQYINNINASHALYAASVLTKQKIDFQEINDFLYLESLSDRLARNKFKDFLLTENNVAYRFNDYKTVLESKLTFNHISRGFVNSMAGITEVYIWANFTENEEGKVIAELRSRKIGIVDIAKKYGGGGHLHACGATLKDFDEAKLLLNDLDERIKSYDFKNNL